MPLQRVPASIIQIAGRSAPQYSRIKATDKDRIDGGAKTVAGTIKEAAGKIVGDQKTIAEGQAEKATGKLQNAVGGVKDAVRDALKTSP